MFLRGPKLFGQTNTTTGYSRFLTMREMSTFGIPEVFGTWSHSNLQSIENQQDSYIVAIKWFPITRMCDNCANEKGYTGKKARKPEVTHSTTKCEIIRLFIERHLLKGLHIHNEISIIAKTVGSE